MNRPTDEAARLWWGRRRALPALIAGVVAAGVIAAVLLPRLDSEQYVAPALIVAGKLGPQTDLSDLAAQLPSYTSAVYADGGVADRAVDVGALPFSANKLEKDHVRFEPVESTLALRVSGVADIPQLAARVANAVSSALVE